MEQLRQVEAILNRMLKTGGQVQIFFRTEVVGDKKTQHPELLVRFEDQARGPRFQQTPIEADALEGEFPLTTLAIQAVEAIDAREPTQGS